MLSWEKAIGKRSTLKNRRNKSRRETGLISRWRAETWSRGKRAPSMVRRDFASRRSLWNGHIFALPRVREREVDGLLLHDAFHEGDAQSEPTWAPCCVPPERGLLRARRACQGASRLCTTAEWLHRPVTAAQRVRRPGTDMATASRGVATCCTRQPVCEPQRARSRHGKAVA